MYLTYHHGNYKALTHGRDSFGNVCGENNTGATYEDIENFHGSTANHGLDMSLAPYLYVIDAPAYTDQQYKSYPLTMCVRECPDSSAVPDMCTDRWWASDVLVGKACMVAKPHTVHDLPHHPQDYVKEAPLYYIDDNVSTAGLQQGWLQRDHDCAASYSTVCAVEWPTRELGNRCIVKGSRLDGAWWLELLEDSDQDISGFKIYIIAVTSFLVAWTIFANCRAKVYVHSTYILALATLIFAVVASAVLQSVIDPSSSSDDDDSEYRLEDSNTTTTELDMLEDQYFEYTGIGFIAVTLFISYRFVKVAGRCYPFVRELISQVQKVRYLVLCSAHFFAFTLVGNFVVMGLSAMHYYGGSGLRKENGDEYTFSGVFLEFPDEIEKYWIIPTIYAFMFLWSFHFLYCFQNCLISTCLIRESKDRHYQNFESIMAASLFSLLTAPLRILPRLVFCNSKRFSRWRAWARIGLSSTAHLHQPFPTGWTAVWDDLQKHNVIFSDPVEFGELLCLLICITCSTIAYSEFLLLMKNDVTHLHVCAVVVAFMTYIIATMVVSPLQHILDIIVLKNVRNLEFVLKDLQEQNLQITHEEVSARLRQDGCSALLSEHITSIAIQQYAQGAQPVPQSTAPVSQPAPQRSTPPSTPPSTPSRPQPKRSGNRFVFSPDTTNAPVLSNFIQRDVRETDIDRAESQHIHHTPTRRQPSAPAISNFTLGVQGSQIQRRLYNDENQVHRTSGTDTDYDHEDDSDGEPIYPDETIRREMSRSPGLEMYGRQASYSEATANGSSRFNFRRRSQESENQRRGDIHDHQSSSLHGRPLSQSPTFPSAAAESTSNSAESGSREVVCQICYDKLPSVMLQPCRHIVFCQDCQENFNNLSQDNTCPICRTEIEQMITVFLP